MKIDIRTSFGKGKNRRVSLEMEQHFATCIVDPDWPYTVAPGVADITTAIGNGKLSGFTRNRDKRKNQYKQDKPLSIDELKALPVGKLVGGYVFMWTVGPFLVNGSANAILNAWGFEPATVLTWAKYDLKHRHGYGGVGFWFLGNAEFCVVGKRPGWPSIRTCRSSLVIEPKTKHSCKPDNVHNICEECFPGPYLELFGRRQRQDWVVLGNEAPGDGGDIRESMQRLIDSPLQSSSGKGRRPLKPETGVQLPLWSTTVP